jgi:hypothetical protein
VYLEICKGMHGLNVKVSLISRVVEVSTVLQNLLFYYIK